MRITGWTSFDNPQYEELYPDGGDCTRDDIDRVERMIAQELRDKGLEIAENMIFIYDQKEEYIDIPFSEDCEFLASTGKDHNRLVCLDKEEMLQRVKREKNEKIVYYLVIEDEKIVKLQEQYVTKY